jgi:hypothetical protein
MAITSPQSTTREILELQGLNTWLKNGLQWQNQTVNSEIQSDMDSRRFDWPALLVPHKPARQIAAMEA